MLNNFKERFDHRRYNGAILLGLKGISVKSHGSADAFSFGFAIGRAYDAAENRVVERIAGRMAQTAVPDTTTVRGASLNVYAPYRDRQLFARQSGYQ